MTKDLFLGIDGGQSHTEAVIADAEGNILSRGFGGPSNHAEKPGGRERLRDAVMEAAGRALLKADPKEFGSLSVDEALRQVEFAAAHCGMTGGADFKREVIEKVLNARHLDVGHDAPTALRGATGGKPGIVVIAGTGSVVYGENSAGETVQVGGLGYLFSDEGSGFWLAAQTIRLAIKEKDGLIPPAGLEKLVLDFFKVGTIRELTTSFYNEIVTRDEIARFAATVAAAAGASEILADQIRAGCTFLSDAVAVTASRLGFVSEVTVTGVGGMFRSSLVKSYFAEMISKRMPAAAMIEPKFGPAVGALLLAYKAAGVNADENILGRLERSIENE